MDMKKLNKGLTTCAGPNCGEECPYYGETKGGKTCRAWLLTDAQAAVAAKEAENAALAEEVNRITAERDKLRKECDTLLDKLNYLTKERNALRAAKDELDAELHRTQQREAAMLNGETDRKSVHIDIAKSVGEMIAQAKYQEGRADALWDFIEKYFFEAVAAHE